MNSKIKIDVIVFLLLVWISLCFAQGNWELMLPPSPTSNQLVSLYFIDENRGWAVGEYGTIVKTSDGGGNWDLVETDWSDHLRDVFFPSAEVGYAVGENGLIIKSNDSGANWTKLTSSNTEKLNRIRFQNESNGWIIGEKGLILHTTDGGYTWNQQLSNTSEELKGIAIINHNNVCVVGTDSTILITIDKGQNWQSADFTPNSYWTGQWQFDFNDVFFLDDTLGWIGGNRFVKKSEPKGMILKTTDRGQSWTEDVLIKILDYEDNSTRVNELGFLPYSIQQIYFNDLKRGICLLGQNISSGYRSSLHRDIEGGNVPLYTQNKGMRWSSVVQGSDELNDQAGRFCVLTDEKAINTGYGGEFRFSYDRGKTWEYPNDSQRIIKQMIYCNNGQLLATKASPNGTDYVFSDDFGKTWIIFNPEIFDSTGAYTNIQLIYHIQKSFIDKDDNLWLIHQYSGQIFKSEDFGFSWHSVRSGINQDTTITKFLTPDTLIHYELEPVEAGQDSFASELIFNYSFDGGYTIISNRFPGLWNDLTQPSHNFFEPDKYINDCYFLNGQTGFLVGSDGNIIKTTDTGQTWTSISSGVVEDLMDIEFVNRSVGFVTGKSGIILKTEDGGDTWRTTSSSTQDDIYSVAFKNENQGWAGTESGLRYTTDGGENWESVPLRYYHGLVRYVKFDNNGNGYAYTPSPPGNNWEEIGIDAIRPQGYNFLLCWKSGANLVEEYTVGSKVPKTLELYANYPNPFNPCTKITYYLPKTGSVCLKIYNIQGQLVRTVVDSKQTEGEHTVSWDGFSDRGTMVTSGVYVYRIESENEFKTRKMLLLR